MTVAEARRTSMVSGKSQNPSRKPRTAVSAAMRPPLAPPMPSAIAATTSCRGSGNSAPMRAPAKSSFSLRGPVFEQNPTIARTPGSPAAAAPAPPLIRSPRFPESAAAIAEVAAGTRGDGSGQRPGPAVERIVAAVLRVEPGDLGASDLGRIGVDGRSAVIDRDLPGG